MKIKPSTLVSSAALALGVLAAGAGITYAAAGSGQSSNPMNSLVSAIAQKFNLNTADVQKVFDDQHAQMDAQRQQAEKDRLAQAVTDGKLTQAQADLITAKRAELEAGREADKTVDQNMTREQRQADHKAEMDALQKWATDNNIPLQYLMPGPGFGHGHGGRGFGLKSHDQQITPNSSTSNINQAQ